MKKCICIFISYFIFSTNIYASYIQDLDYPVPEQLIQVQPWKEINCNGGSYEFLPNFYEWVSWGFNPTDFKKLKPEDAIETKHNEVNTWEVSYADRFCKLMYNFSSYNLVSFISMYNELIPYQNVAYGDINLKFNYPFDIREYSWIGLYFNSIDWKEQERWLQIRNYLSDDIPDYINGNNLELNIENELLNQTKTSFQYNDKNEERNKEFLYKTNIPKIITLFDNILPTSWSLPASPGDFGLIGNIEDSHGRKKYSLVKETRKDYSYSHKINKQIWENSPYNMWRYAAYASRWYFPDIVNAIAGELNMRTKISNSTYPYNNIPQYFWEVDNIIIPISENTDKKQGIQKFYDYCRIMKCLPYNIQPKAEYADIIFKYSKEIFQYLNNPYKFVPSMAFNSNEIRDKISEIENIEIDFSTWYYTIAYMINARGVAGYE